VSARLGALAVLLALVLAGDASAQSSPTFGGGRLTTVSAAPRGYVPTVGVSLQPRGSQIAVCSDTSLRCGSDLFDVTGRKLVAFDGISFSAAAASVQHNDNSPGLDVGGYGRGCNESTSRFTVDQLAFDPDGTVRTFQVTFEQPCENAEPALRGTWTFHAA